MIHSAVAVGAAGSKSRTLSGDVDAGGLVALEGLAHGVVVEVGVDAGHLGAGVAEDALDDVLGDAGVDQPGAEGVAELVGGDAHAATAFVVEADRGLPLSEPGLQQPVGVGQGAVVVVAWGRGTATVSRRGSGGGPRLVGLGWRWRRWLTVG